MTDPAETEQSATAVISHHVKAGQEGNYEKWLGEIVPISKTYPGHIGVQIIRPVAGATTKYTVIVRFDRRDHLLTWMDSTDRRLLIEKVQPFLADDDKFCVVSGLDFWFTPEGAKARLPTRWKQFFVTWSAIYPLAVAAPLAVNLVMRQLGLPDNQYLKALIVTCIVVLLMVYVIMPRYTKLVHRWLFR
ncbi:MAG: antibiotic biosynthesis monooxygenase [Azospirillum sp.]|nr:antibiotic biosynthesis monooxygenase [Azospirillum sp.]